MAKAKNNYGAIALVVVALLIVGLFVFGIPQKVIVDESAGTVGTCPDSTGVLTVSPRSALIGGSDPSSPTITCGINGGPVTTVVTSGSTTFPVGANLECLVSKADYIDKSFKFSMPCGGITLDAPMLYATSDNPSLEIQDKNSNTLTDNVEGGTTNLSVISAGGTGRFKAIFSGSNGEGTGDMVYVIEFASGSSANITDVTMSGLSKVSIPMSHTTNNAGSYVVAFSVPNIEGAIEKTYDVVVTLGSGKTLSGGVYTDWIAGQEFIDVDKTISSGVENADGTSKAENTADYDFYIDAE